MTYRFEVNGFCEIDIEENSLEEAREKLKEYIKNLFDSSLFITEELIELE